MKIHPPEAGGLTSQSVIVWQISDGKAGHANQSRGLIQALAQRIPVENRVIEVRTQCLLKAVGTGRWAEQRSWSAPDLIVGAGHRTHYWMLAARFWRGGRTVVLMRPTFPLAWFDLGIVSEHDQPRNLKNALVVRGALNTLQYSVGHDPKNGLFLIGGPCRHARWANDPVIRQVLQIVSAQPTIRWTLTTSRRTPDDFLLKLAAQRPVNLELVPASQTRGDWLPRHLAEAAQVWVSPDSVSMVFEALTSGAAVGLLDLELITRSKLTAGLRQLAEEGWVTPFARHAQERVLPAPTGRLDEAGRCADWIVEHWFRERRR